MTYLKPNLLVFAKTKCRNPFPIENSSDRRENPLNHLFRCSFTNITNKHCNYGTIARFLAQQWLDFRFIVQLWMLVDGGASTICSRWRWL